MDTDEVRRALVKDLQARMADAPDATAVALSAEIRQVLGGLDAREQGAGGLRLVPAA